MLEQFIFGVTADGDELRRGQAQRRPSSASRRSGSPSRPASRSPTTRRSSWPRSPSVGPQEPLTREKLAPGAGRAARDEHRARHHAGRADGRVRRPGPLAPRSTPQDDALAEEFGSRVKAVRIIANAPSSLGGIGDIYNAFIPSLTLGCGSYGHNSVSNNVSAVNLLNIKRIGRRNNNLQWFKVPAKTYFEPNAIRYLARHARRRARHHRHRRDHDDPRASSTRSSTS